MSDPKRGALPPNFSTNNFFTAAWQRMQPRFSDRVNQLRNYQPTPRLQKLMENYMTSETDDTDMGPMFDDGLVRAFQAIVQTEVELALRPKVEDLLRRYQ